MERDFLPVPLSALMFLLKVIGMRQILPLGRQISIFTVELLLSSSFFVEHCNHCDGASFFAVGHHHSLSLVLAPEHFVPGATNSIVEKGP